ncbi:MAG: hypothetical protein JW797_09735 [Bradymonadales bacterium]|nr:hypothetical protein [Bradymonadales bacterium]
MDALEKDFTAGLFHSKEPPCLSLYQPTHRFHPENRQDPIRFKNLVKEMSESLLQKYPSCDVSALVKPFAALSDDVGFWKNTLDGLAVLASADLFRVYRLQHPVKELAIVADTFHIKPLIRILQSAGGYQVLGLDRQKIMLFKGNRDALDEIELAPGVPRTITDALGEELTPPHLTVASYGGVGKSAMVHGHGSKKDEVELDAERFFRAVDRAILEHHSRPTNLPLVLAALPEHLALFRKISHNPFLVSGGVDLHPDSLSVEELRRRAWEVVEPQYLARLDGLVEEFGAASARGLGTGERARIAEAAVAGRIETLLIDADRVIPGRINHDTGEITYDDLAHPETDDLLDELGELVLQRSGKVAIVPTERMPTQTGVAAIFRY